MEQTPHAARAITPAALQLATMGLAGTAPLFVTAARGGIDAIDLGGLRGGPVQPRLGAV